MELLKNLEGMSADEQMTAVVELQKAAMKQLEEQKQVSIGKSAEMVIQGLKKIKSDFEAKFDSLNYDIQAKVANLKDGEQGIQGPKGDQGDRGLDGANGKDGRDGKDGQDGLDGVDGVGVRDAKIDFDGSLVISLTDGREINCGEVVSVDVAKQIQKVTHNIQTGAGGDSQTVLDAIAALQATIATYGTMATQNANNVAISGGNINNTVIGGTTPAAGTFTTLTATGQTSLGGVAGSEGLRVLTRTSAVNWLAVQGATTGSFVYQLAQGSDSNVSLGITSKGSGAISLGTNTGVDQMRVSHTASAVNYVQVTGAATTKAVIQSAQGSDSNISFVTQTKGTGAIDLAAGSSGVNISNGGTVTALTVTGGTGYTTTPTVAITAPTTAGGVQATASVARMFAVGPTIQSGGTGYTLNDVITLVGGTPLTVAATYTVTAVTGGVVTALSPVNYAVYTAIPSNPCSTTGGTGSGLTINAAWNLNTLSITNAGSGYVEQPTVSFSGGGGSGAAAYATVGSGTIIDSLGSTMSFYTPGGEQVRIVDSSSASTNYVTLGGGTGSVSIFAGGSATNIAETFSSKGTGSLNFQTNTFAQTQLVVAHTASAVNYVQVTGAATGQLTLISTAGSDASVGIEHRLKGTPTGPGYRVTNNNGSNTCFAVTVSGANVVNYMRADPAPAGSATGMSSQGSDTNIDLALTPKGTGNVRFGTYTANMALTVQGYIEIKDSGGTVRKLAVIA